MSGFSSFERDPKCFSRPKFAHEDDVRFVPQSVGESLFETTDMVSDFLLSHQSRSRTEPSLNLNGVQITIFNRVFDRDDMLVVLATDPIDNRRQRRGFA